MVEATSSRALGKRFNNFTLHRNLISFVVVQAPDLEISHLVGGSSMDIWLIYG